MELRATIDIPTTDIPSENSTVVFSINNSSDGIIGINTIVMPNKTSLSTNGSATAILSIRAEENATVGPITLPLTVIITFPSQLGLKNQSIATEYGLDVTVLDPLTVVDQVQTFYQSAGISTAILTITTVLTFGYFIGFTKFSRVTNNYKRRLILYIIYYIKIMIKMNVLNAFVK